MAWSVSHSARSRTACSLYTTNFDVGMIASPCVLINDECEYLAKHTVKVKQKEDDDHNDHQTIHHKQPKVADGLKVGVVGSGGCCFNEKHE